MSLRTKLSPLRDKILGIGGGDRSELSATVSDPTRKVKVTDKAKVAADSPKQSAGRKGKKGKKPTSKVISQTDEAEEAKSDDSREPGEELYECERCGNDAAGVIQCERCMKWCCGSCQNVTLEMIEALDRWPNLHWFCTVCDPIAMEAVCTSMTEGKISHAGALEKRMDKMLEGVAKQLGDIIQDGKDRIKVGWTR